MNTFKQYINEKFQTYIKGVDGEPFEVHINPTIWELQEIGYNIRGLLDTTNDNFYIWNASKGLHVQVYENRELIKDPTQIITLEIYLGDGGLIDGLEVSTSIHNLPWDKNPKTKDRIINSKNIKPLIAKKAFDSPNLVTYYDGTKWDRIKKSNTTNK